jgi:hypothetical protein
MWDYEPTDEFSRRVKRFAKDHPRELTAVMTNLDRVQKSLREGANPFHLPLGCIHGEQRGVLAVDQKGGGKNLMQARLYIYLDRDSKMIHVITLGDKGTQRADVKFSSDFVESLDTQKGKGESHG